MGRLTTLKARIPVLGQQPSKQGGWANTQRGNTTQRGLGWAWQKLRERVLERDCGLCQPCKRAGRITPATEVDHIHNRAEGGTVLDEANAQSICAPCHKAKTAEESKRGRGL